MKPRQPDQNGQGANSGSMIWKMRGRVYLPLALSYPERVFFIPFCHLASGCFYTECLRDACLQISCRTTQCFSGSMLHSLSRVHQSPKEQCIMSTNYP